MILALAVLGAGCGAGASHHSSSSSSTSAASSTSSSAVKTVMTRAESVCVSGRPVVAARMGVTFGAVSIRAMRSPTDGMPVCRFQVSEGRGPLTLSVELDDSPQPYQVLERRSVEEGQNFAFIAHFKSPQAIMHLGLDAWWFPREQQTQTTDGRVLITVTIVRWRGHGNGLRKALSAAVARPYLGPLIGRRTDKGEA
jgi:hypothetical protein